MKKEKTKIITAAGTGLAIGAAMGVLFAPRKGSETRKMIADSISNMKDKVLSIDKESIKKKITKKINSIENELSKIEVENNIKKAKKEAKRLMKKINKLIGYTKSKGLNEFESMTIDLKKKVSDITDKVLEEID